MRASAVDEVYSHRVMCVSPGTSNEFCPLISSAGQQIVGGVVAGLREALSLTRCICTWFISSIPLRHEIAGGKAMKAA